MLRIFSVLSGLLLAWPVGAAPKLSYTVVSKKTSDVSSGDFQEEAKNLTLIAPLYNKNHLTGFYGKEYQITRSGEGFDSFRGYFRGLGLMWLGPWDDGFRGYLSTVIYGRSVSEAGHSMTELTTGLLYRRNPEEKIRFIWRARAYPFRIKHVVDLLYETVSPTGINYSIGTSKAGVRWNATPDGVMLFARLDADSQSYLITENMNQWTMGIYVRMKIGLTLSLFGPVRLKTSVQTGQEFLEFYDDQGDLVREEKSREPFIFNLGIFAKL